MPRIYRTCVQCKSVFYVTERAQDFYAHKCRCGHQDVDHDARYEPACKQCSCDAFIPLSLPKRCWQCRQTNRSRALESQFVLKPEDGE